MSDWGWVALGFAATGITIGAYLGSLVYRRRSLLQRIEAVRSQDSA
ncbi:MAG: hypothetical protein KJN71_05800 [Acidimicrobiia bacterium]|nr:hypothetical protein [Acidimicrobiia bacterium]NNC75130.1 hypothetical protein [Acidimicrobiia bacterium]